MKKLAVAATLAAISTLTGCDSSLQRASEERTDHVARALDAAVMCYTMIHNNGLEFSRVPPCATALTHFTDANRKTYTDLEQHYRDGTMDRAMSILMIASLEAKTRLSVLEQEKRKLQW